MFLRYVQTGWFLAVRQIRRASMWTNLLIVFVMMLTFLNLVVVSGILVGLIESSALAYRKHHAGDVIISNRLEKTYIERSQEIIDFAKSLPEVTAVSGRYIEGGKVESGYKERTRAGDILDNASGLLSGIDPLAEDRVTGLSTKWLRVSISIRRTKIRFYSDQIYSLNTVRLILRHFVI